MTKKKMKNQIALQQSKTIQNFECYHYYHFPEFYKAAVGKELLLHMPLSPDFTKLQRFTVYTS